jgi:hypothetical protein
VPRKVTRLISRLTIAVALVAVANVATTGSASAYVYDPPWADGMGALWPDLDTRPSANNVKARFEPAGGTNIYNAFSSTPSSAYASMGTAYAQSDAIWWMAGHGGPGFITTLTSGGVGSFVSVGSLPGSICSFPNTCLTQWTSTQMHRIRLMMFEGCETGKAVSNGDSLPKRAYTNLGADSSVGFSELIYFPFANTWADVMARDSMYSFPHNTVSQASWQATNYLTTFYGQAYGMDSLVIYGGGVYLYPAAYGS